jgi:polysaccharide deacetylase family protein (PEP-CTERM system associated)
MNILTFDIEDWFCHDNYTQDFNWNKYEVRIHKGVDLILEELDKNQQKGTFFCLGWIAENQPEIIKKIHDSGHQIGCHSYQHQLSMRFNKKEFLNDTGKAQKLLEDVIGEKITLYRAPSFSITKSNLYAFEALVELGFEADCSVFPAERECGGLSDYSYAGPAYISYNGITLKEWPISLYSFFNKKIVFSGGGYFRILPYDFTKYLTNKTDYVMTYFHPSDFDPGQPKMKHLSLVRRWKNEAGLNGSYSKFQKYLSDFDFINIAEADKLIDWNSAKTITLK